MKLLAENTEDRYQTASGVEADLQRCPAEWESYGRINPFPLGAHDASDRLLIPEKLYGRQREIERPTRGFRPRRVPGYARDCARIRLFRRRQIIGGERAP
jgi:hypothetical protein